MYALGQKLSPGGGVDMRPAVNMRDGENDETRLTMEIWTMMGLTENRDGEVGRAPTIVGRRGRCFVMRIEL